MVETLQVGHLEESRQIDGAGRRIHVGAADVDAFPALQPERAILVNAREDG